MTGSGSKFRLFGRGSHGRRGVPISRAAFLCALTANLAAYASAPDRAVEPRADSFEAAPDLVQSLRAPQPLVAPAVGGRTDDRSGGARAGNPLWAVPLRLLNITRERPLFSSSRRPAQVAPTPAVPQVRPLTAALQKLVQRPNFRLLGTIIGDGEGVAVFLDQNTQRVLSLRAGEGREGWILDSVTARSVTLRNGSDLEHWTMPKTSE